MKLLDLTLPTPAENLACDEALLDACEAGEHGEVLRFWEPREPFVVVGYANRVGSEVNVEACATGGIQILRRCSGGGTVLQGPGCLDYSLVLRIDRKIDETVNAAQLPSDERAAAHLTPDTPHLAPHLESITAANRFIMERNRAALAGLLDDRASEVKVRGHTDLALGELKFSGNAQRRHKRCLLFHGTFLLNFGLAAMETFLRMPSKEPDYRRSRSHMDFLTNLGVPADVVKRALREAWKADASSAMVPGERLALLVRERYATKQWNFKFE